MPHKHPSSSQFMIRGSGPWLVRRDNQTIRARGDPVGLKEEI